MKTASANIMIVGNIYSSYHILLQIFDFDTAETMLSHIFGIRTPMLIDTHGYQKMVSNMTSIHVQVSALHNVNKKIHVVFCKYLMLLLCLPCLHYLPCLPCLLPAFVIVERNKNSSHLHNSHPQEYSVSKFLTSKYLMRATNSIS